MTKRVLVTGASGLLGRAVLKTFLSDPEWTVMGLAHSRAVAHLVKVNLTDEAAVMKVVSEFKPTVVIHSAAERRPDIVEKQEEATRRLNVEATQYLCHAADKVNAWLLYMSTDYVFDGTSPPYKTTDVPKPLNTYGKSKLEGEKNVLGFNKAFAVLRVPILYGSVEFLSESAVTVLFDKVKDAQNPCKMSDYEQRYPTFCGDVAAVIKQLSERHLQEADINGVFHWSGNENMTKYDMAVAMAEVFGLPSSHLVPDTTPSSGTSRPYDAHLECSRIEELGFGKRTPYREAIKTVLQTYAL